MVMRRRLLDSSISTWRRPGTPKSATIDAIRCAASHLKSAHGHPPGGAFRVLLDAPRGRGKRRVAGIGSTAKSLVKLVTGAPTADVLTVHVARPLGHLIGP